MNTISDTGDNWAEQTCRNIMAFCWSRSDVLVDTFDHIAQYPSNDFAVKFEQVNAGFEYYSDGLFVID